MISNAMDKLHNIKEPCNLNTYIYMIIDVINNL